MAKKYPAEITAFILANGAMNRKELAELINAKFGTSYTRKQIQSRCTHLGLKAASDGRLKKGGKAWNKGLKGFKPSPGTIWKKGNIPATAKPVGYERINHYTINNLYCTINIKLINFYPLIWVTYRVIIVRSDNIKIIIRVCISSEFIS